MDSSVWLDTMDLNCIIAPRHEISNNVVCATSKISEQPAHTRSDQSLCKSLEYSMTVKLLTEHHLEFLSLTGGWTGSSESTHVKMPHCWKSRVTAQFISRGVCYDGGLLFSSSADCSVFASSVDHDEMPQYLPNNSFISYQYTKG